MLLAHTDIFKRIPQPALLVLGLARIAFEVHKPCTGSNLETSYTLIIQNTHHGQGHKIL